MGLAGLIWALGVLASADDWARIEGFSGLEGQRVIHAIKGPPDEVRPRHWRIETADVLEDAPDTDLAITFATIEVDCDRRSWRVVHEARMSSHGDYAGWDLKDAAFQAVPAGRPIEVYRAAVCERVRGPLKKFNEFDPKDPNITRYFAEL